MKKLNNDNSGFSTIEGVLIVVVTLLLIGGGWLVYKDHHKTKVTTNSDATTQTVKNKATSSSGQQVANSYSGWKTYCDATYNYCFKYPTGWVMSAENNVPGEELLGPTQTARVDYIIEPSPGKGIGSLPFTTETIAKLTSANEDLTAVGGYTVNSSQVVSPVYQIVDNSLLNAYPLSIGQSSKFPAASFTLKGDNSSSLSGGFSVEPIQGIGSVSQAKGWLNSQDAKTGLLILESLYYK